MKLIIGLGNPGKQYDWTRHNIGFEFIDYLCTNKKIDLNESKFEGLFAKVKMFDETVIIAKPMTFMNLSGNFIRKIMDYYKISIQDILIIYDDISLDCGTIKVREKGSAGGHNGIKSIIQNLGNEYFNRIKIGVGQPTKELKDYVLSKFSFEDKMKVVSKFSDILFLVEYFIKNEFQKGMSLVNAKK